MIPLAHPGMIAIHAVVGSDDVWALLPRLKAAGASGILVLPIEKLIASSPSVVSGAPTPPGYAWEATDEQVAERYGLAVAEIVRFDLNTSPAPPERALRLLRRGTFGRPISEYPPSDYRDLVAAAAAAYGAGPTRSWWARGPTRSSTSSPRPSCRPARPPSSRRRPTPCTAC